MDPGADVLIQEHLQKTFALLQAGRNAEALPAARSLATRAPGWAQARHALALALAASGHPDDAVHEFETALQLAPDDPSILRNYGVLLRRAGDAEGAIRCMERLVQAAPGEAAAWRDLGETALRAGQARQAEQALERAVAIDGCHPLAWHLLGNACRRTGNLERAEHAFHKCVELAPTQWTAWLNLGAVLRLTGRPGDAVALYELLESHGYQGPELLDAWAGALLDTGDPEGAIQRAQELTARYPDFTEGHLTLAHLLWEFAEPGRESLAEEAFRRAVRAQPRNATLRAGFVRWLMASRRWDEAVREARALRAEIDAPPIMALEADALEGAGSVRESSGLYRALHAGWGRRNVPFLNAYARHLLRSGEAGHAERVAADALDEDGYSQEAWAYRGTAWRLLGDPREHWLYDYEQLIGVIDAGFAAAPEGGEDGQVLFRQTLERLHRARREPRQQSVRGGTQTAGRLLQRPDPVLAGMRAHLVAAVESWIASLPRDERHPFLSRNSGRVSLGGSWSVRLLSSGAHADHIHPEGWISSAFYVSLPPTVRDASPGSTAGHIRFGQTPADLALDLPAKRVITPKEGRLVLFPSYVWHGTEPFTDDHARLTVAFDMAPLERVDR